MVAGAGECDVGAFLGGVLGDDEVGGVGGGALGGERVLHVAESGLCLVEFLAGLASPRVRHRASAPRSPCRR